MKHTSNYDKTHRTDVKIMPMLLFTTVLWLEFVSAVYTNTNVKLA